MIDYLRTYGQAGTTDVFEGVTYWTDAQLENICDNVGVWETVRFDYFSPLIYKTTKPKFYYLDVPPPQPKEFVITLPDGSTQTIEAHYRNSRGIIEPDHPLTVEYFTFDAFVVNMYEALAMLWDTKASQRAPYVSIDGGNNKMNLAQEYDHCITMRDYYRRKFVKRWER